MIVNRLFIKLVFFLFAWLAPVVFLTAEVPFQGKVVILKGSCSAGKSTLIREIQKKSDDFEIVDEDSIVFQRYSEAIQARYPEESKVILEAIESHNFYHSIRTHQVCFKESVSEADRNVAKELIHRIQSDLDQERNRAWKESVSEGITKEVLEKIRLSLNEKKNVVLDAWYISDEHLNTLFPESEKLTSSPT